LQRSFVDRSKIRSARIHIPLQPFVMRPGGLLPSSLVARLGIALRRQMTGLIHPNNIGVVEARLFTLFTPIAATSASESEIAARHSGLGKFTVCEIIESDLSFCGGEFSQGWTLPGGAGGARVGLAGAGYVGRCGHEEL